MFKEEVEKQEYKATEGEGDEKRKTDRATDRRTDKQKKRRKVKKVKLSEKKEEVRKGEIKKRLI